MIAGSSGSYAAISARDHGAVATLPSPCGTDVADLALGQVVHDREQFASNSPKLFTIMKSSPDGPGT
jgi:hypothetical protein